MSTEAQVKANRKNAQKSTGPKTEEGKAVSAMNAIKHGLTGDIDVVCWEEQADYDRHKQIVLGELQPVGAMEGLLAERVVSLSWRVRRAQLMQREVANYVLAKRTATPVELLVRQLLPKDQPMIKMPQNDPQYAFGRAMLQDWADCAIIDRMSHYEKRLEASLYRTMSEFKKWRLLRKYEAAEAQMCAEGQRDKGTACSATLLCEARYAACSAKRYAGSPAGGQGSRSREAQSRQEAAGRRELRGRVRRTKPIRRG